MRCSWGKHSQGHNIPAIISKFLGSLERKKKKGKNRNNRVFPFDFLLFPCHLLQFTRLCAREKNPPQLTQHHTLKQHPQGRTPPKRKACREGILGIFSVIHKFSIRPPFIMFWMIPTNFFPKLFPHFIIVFADLPAAL